MAVGESLAIETFKSDLKYSNIHVYFGAFASFMSAFLFSIQPILRNAAVFGLDGKKRLQIDIWYPFDFETPLVFETIVLMQFFTVFWVALRFFANDSFFMYRFRTNVSFFKLLKVFSKNVIKPDVTTYSFSSKTVLNNKYGSGKNKWNLNLLYPIVEGVLDENNCAMDLSTGNVLFNEEFDKKTKYQIYLFIKNHQLILR